MPNIQFPAHTQARMDAAHASKRATSNLITNPKSITNKKAAHGAVLNGSVIGLSIAARRDILNCPARVPIAYGSHDKPLVLVDNVNLSMLQHYAPNIVDKFKTTAPAFGATIMLPDEMGLVTERGVKYVVNDMLREIRHGSYRSEWWTKDRNDAGRFTVRPRDNPVEMIHALNTLRAFGMEKDAAFLVKEDGPIAVRLKKKAQNWEKSPRSLERYLLTLDNELLEEQDRHVLDDAWNVHDRRFLDASYEAPKK